MFKHDGRFNHSHRMGYANATREKLNAKFGEGCEYDQHVKVSVDWKGDFTANDGTVMRASIWDYKGSLVDNCVSVWVSNPDYINEFIAYVEK